jgi:hypothetical protein
MLSGGAGDLVRDGLADGLGGARFRGGMAWRGAAWRGVGVMGELRGEWCVGASSRKKVYILTCAIERGVHSDRRRSVAVSIKLRCFSARWPISGPLHELWPFQMLRA